MTKLYDKLQKLALQRREATAKVAHYERSLHLFDTGERELWIGEGVQESRRSYLAGELDKARDEQRQVEEEMGRTAQELALFVEASKRDIQVFVIDSIM